MSEHGDLTAFDDPAGLEPDPDGWAEEPADAWSPVMGTPPPGAEPDIDGVDAVPPHELADDSLPPPAPDPAGVDAPPPPPPPTDGELPPALPDEGIADPVDLSDGGATVGAPPMPPVTGDADAPPPPAAGEVDLSGDGPPLAPDAPPADTGADGQSPVPEMGNQTPVPAMGDQTPVPPMGNEAPVARDGDIDLGTDGPPMPPGIDGTDVEPPPGADLDPAIELPVEPGTELTVEPVDDDVLMAVNPGDERVTAAAVTGAFLDEMGLDDPARERMIGLLEDRAEDGTITIDELYSAFAQAGFEETTTNGSDETLTTVLNQQGALPRTALVNIDGEGIGVFRISQHDGVVELESLQTRSVYVAEPQAVAQAWRESGSRVLTAPAPVPIPVPAIDVPAAAEPAADDDSGSGSGMRNVLLAGAVLLPLAGGAAYLATRKIR